MSDILTRSDDSCTEGLRSPTWVPGWDLPLHKVFMRAITPDKPTTADMTTLIDEFLGTCRELLRWERPGLRPSPYCCAC